MSAAIFLPGQSLTRSLQLNYFMSLDPGASASVHLYSSVFGVTAAVILFRNVKVTVEIRLLVGIIESMYFRNTRMRIMFRPRCH